MPIPGSPVTSMAPPSVRAVARNALNAVHLRLAPDQVAGPATVALPFVVLGGLGVDHGARTRASDLARRDGIVNRRHVAGKTLRAAFGVI